MDLGLTPEQQTVQQEARRFLAAEITRERRLEWDRSPTGYDPAFWRAVSELGWLGYGLPAAHGGQGASRLDVGLLVEEWGRAAAPFGLFAALSGGLALAALGTPAQRRAWLPAVARGEKIVTLAVSEAEVEAEPAALRTALTRRGGRLRLDGEKRFVLHGAHAQAFLVAARDGRGTSVVVVPAEAAGVRPRGCGLAAARTAPPPARGAAVRRAHRRRGGGARDDGGPRERARAVRRQARHLPGGQADGGEHGDRPRRCAPCHPSGALATRRAAARRARGGDRQGVDDARLPRHHAHGTPAPRRRGLRGRASAAPLHAARQARRAALRRHRGVARGPGGSAEARAGVSQDVTRAARARPL